MARIGIHYTNVKLAAIKLLSQGIAPSVQKIRDTLGTGSNTTIAEHLKVWREEYATKEVHHLPTNMPKELIAAIEVLWQTAMEQAENQLVAIKKDLNHQQEKINQEKLATEQTIVELKSNLSNINQKLEEKISQIQSLQTELAVTRERLATQTEELASVRNQYEIRLKRAFDDKDTLIEKSERLQTQITQLQRQLSEQAEKHQAILTQERALQEQSEIRWLKLIDQARTESTNLRKNYENIINKQNTQIETLQNTMTEFQNKYVSQESLLSHANTVIIELKEQLNKLHAQHSEAITTMAVLKTKLEEPAKKKLGKKQRIIT